MKEGKFGDIGRLVILPSTYIRRNECTEHAITYVRKYGGPNLFITCTCNSSWPEIKEKINYGQAPVDYHDIIALETIEIHKCHNKEILELLIHIISWLHKKISPN